MKPSTDYADILKKIVFFGFRLVWALMVLFAICIAWVLLFLIFLPFLVLTFFIKSGKDEHPLEDSGMRVDVDPSGNGHQAMIFDRRHDVSKLHGCNTRNVQYRWNLFAARIEEIRKHFNAPHALDFGAGSLRDSYELARLGFCVTSVDLDPNLMQRYYQSYDWSTARCPAKIFADSLDQLPKQSGFQLAIAFDVIEHLEDPSRYCRTIHSLLDKDGMLFSIVPNRRSIFERYFKRSMIRQRARGIPFVPGVPHLQFKLPHEWEQLFEQCGFKIVEHDMAIGFFVNDCWTGLLGLPLRLYVTPVLSRLAQMFRLKFNPVAFEESFSPPWLMKRVDVLDQMCKKKLSSRFGWNLIVASK